MRNLHDNNMFGRSMEGELRRIASSMPAILDEVQKVPDLLSYVMGAIERDPHPSRFVLTGSQNLLLMERISQTLAGPESSNSDHHE